MAASICHIIAAVCVCLTLLVQRSGSVLATNEVTVSPPSVRTTIGSNITLDCQLAQNTSVVWYQDDKQLPTTTSQLMLYQVTIANKGIYKCCVGQCTTGNFATSAIDIGEGPRQPMDLKCECRDLIQINCSWTLSDEGDMNSNTSLWILDYDTYVWQKLPLCRASNFSPESKRQYCLFKLFDNNFTKSNYKYQTRSTNKYGEALSEEIHFNQYQFSMPYPPDDVIVTTLSFNSINVSWCEPPKWPPPHARSIVFKIEYKLEKADKWIEAGTKKFGVGKHKERQCTNMKIKDLQPYTSYCVQVKSKKDNAFTGFSEPSQVVCATTMENDPGPPFNVKYKILPSTVDDKDTRSVSITWMPVPVDDRNGIILGYRIVLHGIHGDDPGNTTRLEYNVTGDVTNLTVHGLDNYRTYSITVQAFNSAGMSWEKASPDGPIPVAPPKQASKASQIVVALMVPIAIICLAFMLYCIWHRGKKILKPTYDIHIPERARNDNLYVTTVNFRMQESECFDELKAPPDGHLRVDLPQNGTCTYGNGTCPTSDYSDDPCTPGLPSSENFPLLSGHIIEANQNAANTGEENKMLTVDCGENKALLDGHPYADVGYNHTGSPLSVASGGSYWTTGGEENESVSYHRMSPKGLALCEAETDEQWDGTRGAAGGEPSSPDSPSRHMDYSMMGKKEGPMADSVASPKSPTSPVALYSMQASALDPVEDTDSVASEDDPNDISSYVQQTTASSLGLLVPVPQAPAASNVNNSDKDKSDTGKVNEHNMPHVTKDEKVDKKDDDLCSLDSAECADDALDSYVRTGATSPAPQSHQGTKETPATAVDNYVRASHDRDNDLDIRRAAPRVRSASGGALDGMHRTHSSAPEFLEDSDSAISMEDADLQYVQAGCADDLFNPNTTLQNSADPPSPVLPGVAIDFPSDGSGDIQTVNSLAPANDTRSRSLSGDRSRDHSDNDLSDVEYERYNDDSIDGYVTQAHGVDMNGQEACPMLPYVAIDLAEVPKKSTIKPSAAVQGTVEPSQQHVSPRLPQPVSLDSGYVPQNHAHTMGVTKEESPAEKSAYDNPEYGVLAQCLSQLEKQNVLENRQDIEELKRRENDEDELITTSNENLSGSPTNNNSPYVPHGKAPLGQNIMKCPSMVDSGYLPHGKIPGQALPQKPQQVDGTCSQAPQGLPQHPASDDRGYIPINNIPDCQS